MRKTIDHAAVIGAGVMGATLAAHLANAGIRTLLLDIVPPEGTKIDADPATREYRDAFARSGLEKALKAKPAAFYTADKSRLISTGNIEDDIDKLKDVDWVLEAVTERLDIKHSLFDRIAPHLKDTAILSSNTSGLPIAELASVLSDSLKKRFLVTHFFNPPRYMYLLEIVPLAASHGSTDPEVLKHLVQFGEEVLGKGIVIAKDTPNFIANRIGIYSMVSALRAMLEGGYTIEEVDTLTGPVIGRPKSATFRTVDLVGLDTLVHASKTVYDRAVGDECRESFDLPEMIHKMAEKSLLGDKTGMGFYKKVKKDGKSEILTLDYNTFDYRSRERAKFPSLELIRNIDDTAERVGAILKGKDRAAEFLWRVLSETIVYSANRLGEITDDIVQIDRAMKWGFNWELGPFELWDAMGVEKVVARLEKEGREVPAVVTDVLGTESKRFYTEDEKFTQYHFVPGGTHSELPEREATINLGVLKKQNKVVKKNASSSLIDIGDGILCLEFHSKMNAIGADIIQMINAAVKETEQNYDGLVIGNQGTLFSAGANLMLLLLEAQEGNWEDIDVMIRAFQRANMALKYSKRPVVAAPFGMTLAGGCEVCLGAGHVYASAESYIGLVEVGVGLIPAAGGCKELLLRNLEGVPLVDGVDHFPYVRATFETIGMAKVATSAEEARGLRFLRTSDAITLNPDRLIYCARAMAKGLAEQGYRPPDPTVEVPVVGESGLGAIKTFLYTMKEAKYISEYDEYLGGELATVLCGGRVVAGTKRTEQHLLDLEREVFLRLCGQRKTQERIQHMLKKGRPLRN
ncbi:MAG: enoyl-CoA hydratase/isomerase family protein [Candidatus Latescibacterota bacterium]|nr:MAG: enoyl-CoA hydratase/isomerase family protein [Candidatus Latescibacterota bacterium]